jgi:Tfp pilus assembly protein PilF
LASAHFYLAEALAQTGDGAAALPEYEKASRLNPKDAEYSYKYGVALSRIRPQNAANELRRAIELDPQNAEAHRSLGMLLRRTGDLEASASEFQRARELSVEAEKLLDTHVHRDTALQYLRKNNASAAINELRRAQAADPDAPDVDFLLAVALGVVGQQSEARRAFEAALQKKPSAPEIHFNFGVFLGRQGDFQGAAREFRSALALQPAYPQAHCLLAEALARVGDAAASEKELDLARRLASCAPRSGQQ